VVAVVECIVTCAYEFDVDIGARLFVGFDPGCFREDAVVWFTCWVTASVVLVFVESTVVSVASALNSRVVGKVFADQVRFAIDAAAAPGA